MKPIYFDYAATSPTDPEVLKAMEPYFFEHFGNVSSPHKIGRDAKKAIEEARGTLAAFVGASPEEIVFTSGGSESNNHAIFGTVQNLKAKGRHIIASSVEHHSVEKPLEFLARQGFEVTFLPVDRTGLVNPEDVQQAITDKTVLIAVIHANNEIGTIQPIAVIGTIAKEKGITLLVDAVQTVGHIPVNVNEMNCDLLSLSAHKFCGPKGVGALYKRKEKQLPAFILGGDQERGHRASTQNVPGIVGLAKAIALAKEKMAGENEQQKALRDRLIKEIPEKIKGAVLNGHRINRLPNNVHFSFPSIEGEALVTSLDMAGISASQGSACTSGAMEPSRVLRAIGLSDELAHGSLRLTMGRWTTSQDIDRLLAELPKIVEQLK